jgi:hypothetical protein
MLSRFWNRLFGHRPRSRRDIVKLGPALEDLARAGVAGWLVAQEQARLDYLAAKETYERSGSRRALRRARERLLSLQSTSAVIQSLLNEHALERLAAAEEAPASLDVGKSR